MRKTSFAEGEFYHVYNRGVDKRDIFSEQYDLSRFLQSMREFNTLEPIGSIYEKTLLKIKFGSSTPKLVDVICYCLNPNHYHFILRQTADKGIEKFMHRLATGYTNYFNEKYQRSGALFQGRYKAVHIDSNEYLLHLSAYVNLNHLVHQLGSSASKSGIIEQLIRPTGLLDPTIEIRPAEEQIKNAEEEILKAVRAKERVLLLTEQFSSLSEYKNFAKESLKDILERRKMAKEFEELLLE